MLKRLLSPTALAFDLGIVIIRVIVGFMLLSFHGWSKLSNFAERKDTFSDPIGLGSVASLTLVVGAEFFCSIFLILGLFTRIALIPLIINMMVIVFVVHADDTLKERELPIFFLSIFVGLFFTGPGSYSADSALRKRG